MNIELTDRTDAFTYKRGERKPSGNYELVKLFQSRNLAAFNEDGILEFWDAKRFVVSEGTPSVPEITGSPYPGETLTSTLAGQWTANGVNISGETGTSYVVNVRDIGKDIGCGGAPPITIWHPTDVSLNMILLTPNVGALHSIEPDVEATDGQTVRRILDQSGNGWHADQATGANQPIRQVSEVGGNDTLLFDGTNDFMSFSGGALGLFRNRGYGYIIASCRDSSPTTGSNHIVALFDTATVTAERIALYSKTTSSRFRSAGRRLDGDEASQVSPAGNNNENYNVLATVARWQNGEIDIRANGSLGGTGSFAGSGLTSDTDSGRALIGHSSNWGFPGHISCLMVLSPEAALSAVNLARLERYAYLCGPGPTEVTLDPSDPWA